MSHDELIKRLRFLAKTEPCRNIGAVHEAATALTTMQDREATLIRVLERAAENFERLTVPHIVGNDVHDFASQAAKLIREALGTSGLVERAADDSRRPSAPNRSA